MFICSDNTGKDGSFDLQALGSHLWPLSLAVLCGASLDQGRKLGSKLCVSRPMLLQSLSENRAGGGGTGRCVLSGGPAVGETQGQEGALPARGQGVGQASPHSSQCELFYVLVSRK